MHEARVVPSHLDGMQHVTTIGKSLVVRQGVVATDSAPRSKRRFRKGAASTLERFSAKRLGWKTSDDRAIHPLFMNDAG